MRYAYSKDEPEFVSKTEAFQLLANAIVARAALDLRAILQGRGYEDPRREQQIAELESFFLSGYCELLTNVDGKLILQKLKDEVKHGRPED